MSQGTNEREHWGSKLGFIMAAAGSAVGLGNIWKFPYLAGQNGGGAFVVIYVCIIFVIGFSVMLAEMAIGRSAQLNAVDAFRKEGGGMWPIVGWMGVVAGFMILSFYSVVGGWTLKYIMWSFTGLMGEAAAGKAGDVFGAFVTNLPQQLLFHTIFMAMTIYVVYKGIGGGIEKYCKIMMPALFVILLILIVRSGTLEGAGKGFEFYLKPDFSKVTGKSFAAALGQVFFSLSLGMGCMLTYGSYVDKKTHLATSAIQVCTIDTSVAFLAGLAIFPAVFAFGVDAGAGPGLTFVTLPSVFAKMPGSSIWSALFFLLLFFAAITSSISLLEVVAAYFIDRGWSRPKASVVMGILIYLLGVPCAMSLKGTPAIAGKSFFDTMDFLSSNVLLPLGGVFIALFVGWFWTAKARREVTSEGTQSFAFMEPWIWVCRIVAPLGILYIFFTGLKW